MRRVSQLGAWFNNRLPWATTH